MTGTKLLQTLEGHNDRVWNVAWAPNGAMLASCGADKEVRIWERRKQPQMEGEEEAWACTAVLQDGHSRTIRCVSWSPDGRLLATASFDATTAIWQLSKGVWEQVATLEGHENEVKCVAWSPSGSLLATCGRDRSVWVWEALAGAEFECVDVKHGHTQDVKQVAWHPDGELLASCSYDDTIKLWASDGDEWSCVQTLGAGGSGHASTVWSISFDPSGSRLASCSDDRTVKIWERGQPGTTGSSTWHCSATISGYSSRPIFSVDWGPGGVVATGDGENSIRFYAQASSSAEAGVDRLLDTSSRSQWLLLACAEGAHDADVNCVRWHPSEPGLLASCGDDCSVRLWLVTDHLP